MHLAVQSASTGAADAHSALVMFLADNSSPVGPDFGKASPIGLLVILLLLIVVLFLGWSVNKRVKRFNQRRLIADEMGINVFDADAVDAEMARRGLDSSARLRRTAHAQDIAHSAEVRNNNSGLSGGASDTANRPHTTNGHFNSDVNNAGGDSEATKG